MGKRGKILLTHMHFDHFGAIYRLQYYNSFELMIHELERDYLERGDPFYTVANIFGIKEIMPIHVTKSVKDGEIIKIGNINIHVLHTPGHTIGSICLYIPEYKILVSGDTLFSNGLFGRTDLPTGSIKNLLDSLRKLSGFNFDILLPGHGSMLTEKAKKSLKLALSFARDFW